jgi:hypothetical protein
MERDSAGHELRDNTSTTTGETDKCDGSGPAYDLLQQLLYLLRQRMTRMECNNNDDEYDEDETGRTPDDADAD